jgi:hypothetical protein
MWWLVPAIIVMFACAASSIPMGAWLLATSRWPSWMRGALKWPLGNSLSTQVIRLQGWAYLLAGGASLVLLAFLLALPALLASDPLTARWIVGVVLVVTVALTLAGCVPYVRSVRMSRR